MTRTEKKKKTENLIPAPKCSVLKEQNGFTRVIHRKGLRFAHAVSRQLLITAITLDRCVCTYSLGFWVFVGLGFFFLWRGKSFAFASVLGFTCFSVFFCSCVSYHLGTEMAMSKLSYKSKLLGF